MSAPQENAFYAMLAQVRRNKPRLAKHRRQPLAEKTYLICFTPRSGSSWLCDVLRGEGLGKPNEFLNAEHMRGMVKRTGAGDAVEYLEVLRRIEGSPPGVFGMKASWFQLEQALAGARVEDLLGPQARYVYLTRRDFVLQGVSLCLSTQSGYFHSVQKPERAAAAKEKLATLAYDGTALRPWIDHILAQEHGFEAFFAGHGVEPLHLAYEDLVDKPDAAVKRIAAHLGLDSAGVPRGEIGSAYEKIGTERNRDWARRFRAEHPAYVEFWKKNRGRVHPAAAPPCS